MKINDSTNWAVSIFNNQNKNVSIQKVVETSYSIVQKIEITKDKETDTFYLKTNTFDFNYEAEIINYLSLLQKQNNLFIVAQNKELNSFISKDAGNTLFQYFQHNKDIELLKNAMRTYGEMQRKIILEELKKLNIRDFSTQHLYQILIQKLKSNDAFFHYIHKFQPYEALIENDIKILNESKLQDSLEHGDFHLGNILVNDKGELTYIDFAEGTIANPIFSLISFILSLSRRLQISPNSDLAQDIKKEYLESYAQHIGESKERMYYLYDLSIKLSDIYYAIAMIEILKQEPDNNKWKDRIRVNLDNALHTYSS